MNKFDRQDLPTSACEAAGREASELSDLLSGGEYNFKYQPERLRYIGKRNGWHQFERIGKQGVWCELTDHDLHLIKETKAI